MKLTNVKHIFFDLDHTLWDFDKNSALTFQKIFKLNNIDLDTEQFLKVYEPINLHYWKLYREERVVKSDLRYRRLKDSFDSMNFSISDDVIDKLALDYIDYLTTFNHLFEDAIDILDYLSPMYQLHIITNGFEEAQMRKIQNSNMHHYFKTITNSEMVGVKKPNLKIFNYALQNAKAVADESIMIGDNYEADIEGAINAGFDTLFVNYHNIPEKEEVKTIKRLSEIRRFL